ncbi:lysylphosphatidylglycerol synthase transmembrane domain-containing protein [Azospirillum brasilense]|uniref:Lysylphosphatidylglycerol synthetase n=1 Tax=Azospirillum brasilense TaxID=192 RepID=A0A235HAR0_AZOBR|nr:lysylphosphatidylglycerol synthase transmembrane domain-containing protein [Azospirillum brasilense]OYD82909.1 lysylphosphatidylglycerol synthetase [Azospirillum brasilense]
MRKKILGLGVSLAILALIYTQIDLGALGRALLDADAGWLAVSLGMVVPLTLLTAWRLSLLTPVPGALKVGEALRLTLIAGVLNMVLPSKMGDVAKAYAITRRTALPGPAALALVVFEKGWDMIALLLWCVAALLVLSGKGALFWTLTLATGGMLAAGLLAVSSPRTADLLFRLVQRVAPSKLGATVGALAEAWDGTLRAFWSRPARAAALIALSVFLWFLHLLQIWLFILALNGWAPFGASLGLAALAILAGLLPLTFAGVGTRDAALILLFQPYLAAPTASALGLLCTTRYLLPALAGLPLIGPYLDSIRAFRRGDAVR